MRAACPRDHCCAYLGRREQFIPLFLDQHISAQVGRRCLRRGVSLQLAPAVLASLQSEHGPYHCRIRCAWRVQGELA